MMPDTPTHSDPYGELSTVLDEIGSIARTSPRVLPPRRMRDLLDRVLADLGDLLTHGMEALREQQRELVGRVETLRRDVGRKDIVALQREVFTLVQAIQLYEHGELGLLQPGIATQSELD